MSATGTIEGLGSLTKQAEIRLVEQLGSFLVGEPAHLSVSVVDLHGSVIASSSPDHLGNAEAVAAAVVGAFPSLGVGDAVVVSDPYSGSAHVQDHWIALPFHEGGSPRALVVVQAHLADVGGQAFGNYYPYARDVWQEGVVTTPVRLVRGGAMDGDVMSALKLNSRAPVLIGHDITLMHRVGLEVAERLSPGALAAEIAAQIPVAHERVRELATRITEDVVLGSAIHNCAGPDARVSVTLATGGRKVVVDLTDCSSQVEEGFINSTLATTRSAVARAFIQHTGAPFNSGVLDALEIRTTSGSIIDCRPPVAVGWSPFEPGLAIVDLLCEALSRWSEQRVPLRVREPIRPPVRIDGCRREGCRF